MEYGFPKLLIRGGKLIFNALVVFKVVVGCLLFNMGEKEELASISMHSQRFIDDCLAFDVVNNMVDFVLNGVQAEVDRKYFENLAVPLAADIAMVKIRRLCSWALLEHDGDVKITLPSNPSSSGANADSCSHEVQVGAEPFDSEETKGQQYAGKDEDQFALEALEYLSADQEPTPLIIDPWARGYVPIKIVKVEDKNAMYRTLSGETTNGNMSPRSQSVGSRVSSNTGTSRSGTTRRSGGSKYGGTTTASRIGTAAGSRIGEGEEEDPTGQIFDLEDDWDPATFGGAAQLSFEQLLKQQAKLKPAEEEGGKLEIKSEFERLQDEIDSQVQDLPKGKKYVIDREGHVIPLNPVKAGQLPPYQINPETKISNYKEPSTNRSSRGGSRDFVQTAGESVEAQPATAKNAKKRVIRVAGSRQVDENLFMPSHTLADTLSTGDGLMPTAGVVVKVNEQVRNGSIVPSIPGKMSRKEYFSRNNKEPIGIVDDDGEGGDGFGQGSMDNLRAGEGAFDGLPVSMGGAPQMRSDIQYKIPDVDPLEGGRSMKSQLGLDSIESSAIFGGRNGIENSLAQGTYETDAELGLGPVSQGQIGEPKMAFLPGPKDANCNLFEHDTSHTGKPKDRDLPLNMRLPSQRTKPLAPAPGQVGHFDSPDRSGAYVPPFSVSQGGSQVHIENASIVSRTKGSPLGSPAGSQTGGSVHSETNRSQKAATNKKGKVGVIRTKAGTIKNEKPHISAQLF